MTRSEAMSDGVRLLVAAGIPAGEAASESRLLLQYAAALSREELRMRPELPLTMEEETRWQDTIARRAHREPFAYITGEREFYGMPFTVSPSVLVPRPETEGVVEAVLDLLSDDSSAEVLDLCTGSGAIAVAIAAKLPNAHVAASDVSADALAIARTNAARNGVASRLAFYEGDLFDALPQGARYDVIASNPPYIAPAEIETLEPEVRDYEPRIALGVHADALHFYRRIAAESMAFLQSDGSVVVEIGQGQAEDAQALFRDAGFRQVDVLPDLAGIPRVVVSRR